MDERKYSISSVQLFFILFSYVFSGLFIYSDGVFFPVILTCIFLASMCVVARLITNGFDSSKEFFSSVFGKTAPALRIICAVFVSFSLIGTLFEFSNDVSLVYGGNISVVFIVVAGIAVFSVWNGFYRAARFSELCLFSVLSILLVSLFSGGGGKFDFSFDTNAVMSSFHCMGNVAVIFSLYLSCITEKDEIMSEFMRNGSFHPSPLASGIIAVFSAGILYIFVNLMAMSGENLLISFFSWFLSVTRIFAFSICICDLCGIPQRKAPEEKRKGVFFAAVLFIFSILVYGYVPSGIILESESVFDLIFPCALFAFLIFKGVAQKDKA